MMPDGGAPLNHVLKSRPQNYESLSLTNSTEFGQHSIGSSVDIKSMAQLNSNNKQRGDAIFHQ